MVVAYSVDDAVPHLSVGEDGGGGGGIDGLGVSFDNDDHDGDWGIVFNLRAIRFCSEDRG